MDYRNLGSAGVKVSPLCLGTMMFGEWGNRDHQDCIRIIHRALDAGINFIDTANMYSDGESEEIVAKALKGRNEETVVATKVFFPMGPGPNQRGLSRKAIQEQVNHSLKRLQMEAIDLYQIHRPDPSTPWEETLRALDDLVRQGKVHYLGCSTNHQEANEVPRLEAWQIAETVGLCQRHGWESFSSLQPPYSILRRNMEVEHFPMTQRFGIGNMVWSPLEGGWLTGKYRRGQPLPDTPRAHKWVKDVEDPKFDRRIEAVEALTVIARDKGVPLPELALAWTLVQPAVSSVIIGPRTFEQLESCLRALEIDLTEEDLAAIDRIVPPGETVL
ncbi:MAG: aldo/keto reductase [Deltaproteobacteria bacterium]|nr:aldo/keto reductase [Deltaproteobacteria bacterium]